MENDKLNNYYSIFSINDTVPSIQILFIYLTLRKANIEPMSNSLKFVFGSFFTNFSIIQQLNLRLNLKIKEIFNEINRIDISNEIFKLQK